VYPFLAGLGRLFPIHIVEGINLFPALKELIVLIFVLLVIIILFAKKHIIINNAGLILGAYILYDLVSALISQQNTYVIVESLRFQILFPVFALAFLFYYKNVNAKPINYKTIFIIFIFQSIVVKFIAYWEMINPILIKDLFGIGHSAFYSAKQIRIASIMLNQINLGIYSCISIVVSVIYIFMSKKHHIFLYSLIILDIGVILRTFSRNSYLLLVLIALLLVVYNAGKLKIKHALIFPIVLFFFIQSFFLIGEIFPNFHYLVNLRIDMMAIDNIQYTTGRFDKWIFLFQNFIARDLFSLTFGNGIGFGIYGNHAFFTRIENSYLYIILEKGIVGLIIYLILVLKYLSNSIKLLRSKNNQFNQFGYFNLNIVCIMIISSFTSDAFISPPYVFYFWLFFVYSDLTLRSVRAVD